jgi:hypothetical protein
MARSAARLSSGSRVSDYVTLGVVANAFPADKVRQILRQTGTMSMRERALPAHVVVYYVIALSLYMQVSCREVLRCLLEGLEWLSKSSLRVQVVGKSGISQARKRLGCEPIRELHDQIVCPVATLKTRGAWYGNWRLVSLDGSTLSVADTQENAATFSRPGASRGSSAYPQIRFVSLVENGTHVLFGSRMDGYQIGEITLAWEVIRNLRKGMLCLADRNFFGFELWREACSAGADLLWRVKKNVRLVACKRFEDGSYLAKIYPSSKDRRNDTNAITVRVIDYRLVGVPDAEPIYRLVTTIMDSEQAPAGEMAALYHERWEVETALDELKTHLRGSKIVLRSKTPELVRQEFYGLMMAHFAVRGLMHEAAIVADVDPDELSFVHAVRVIRRKLPLFVVIPPSEEEGVS